MRTLILLACLLAAGCGKAQEASQPEAAKLNSLALEAPAPPGGTATATAEPQIAYSYTLGYSLAGEEVARVQARHVALCNALGTARCRIGSTNLNSSDVDNGYVNGAAIFLIDARLAGRFNGRLDAAATGAGGHVADRKVEAEDLTKQIVDTDARVRAKQALADRLVTLIRSANAKVGELIEAERAYAETQEELDAARQLQAALRQRVAMSEVTVNYTSFAATSGWRPVADSVRAVGSTLSSSIAALVTFVVAALPWALLLSLVVWALRRRGWRPRWPWRRREPT